MKVMSELFYTLLGVIFVILFFPIYLLIQAFGWVFFNMIEAEHRINARRINKKIRAML